LHHVNVQFRSHYNSPNWPKARAKYLTSIAKKLKEPLYAMDDNSAVEVVDGKIKVVSEGKYLILGD
jgi:hypothetical protein